MKLLIYHIRLSRVVFAPERRHFCAAVVPQVIMKISDESRARNWNAARRAQFKLLDLFSLMVKASNLPEGFREGYQLRGFKTGQARLPLSAHEQVLLGGPLRAFATR